MFASSASELRRARANAFLPYRKSVKKFVLYQQQFVILGDKPHKNRSLLSMPGEASTAAASR
jgi:hypothetical protein